MSVRTFVGYMAVLTICLLAPAGRSQCISECSPRFGIVSAFGGEADILLSETTQAQKYVINGNEFTTGLLHGNRVVIVLTGISFENAAMIDAGTLSTPGLPKARRKMPSTISELVMPAPLRTLE